MHKAGGPTREDAEESHRREADSCQSPSGESGLGSLSSLGAPAPQEELTASQSSGVFVSVLGNIV